MRNELSWHPGRLIVDDVITAGTAIREPRPEALPAQCFSSSWNTALPVQFDVKKLPEARSYSGVEVEAATELNTQNLASTGRCA